MDQYSDPMQKNTNDGTKYNTKHRKRRKKQECFTIPDREIFTRKDDSIYGMDDGPKKLSSDLFINGSFIVFLKNSIQKTNSNKKMLSTFCFKFFL